jgi:hypothetical protein
MRTPTMIAASLVFAVSGCNNPPAPQTVSHPSAQDLTCKAEPAGLTDEQVLSDDASQAVGLGRPYERAFNDGVLMVERDCKDTLKRTCQWHKDRGAQVDCDKIVQ